MDIKEYKCPNCSGAVKFDSGIQKMKCPYCDAEFEMAAVAEYQKQMEKPETDHFEIDVGKAGQAWDESDLGDLSTGSCPSCGAELIGDANTIATVCPCCGNTQIMQKRIQGILKPEYVIPFRLDKKAAKEALLEFYKGKKLLPNFFKSENRINSIQGLYVPFWLFDAKAQGNVSFKATKVLAWSDSSYNYSKTDFYSVQREGCIGFEKISVDGSEKMDDDYMDAIEPFDYGKLTNFQSAYLSGYIAEKYDVGIEASKERAIKRIKNSVESQFRSSVTGYTSVTKERSGITVENGKVRYALFPVWILNSKYNNENCQFIMNGQSGLIVGRLPVDKGKAAKYSLLYLFGFGAVFSLIIRLLQILF
jgi:DNA-directed RNA polymerase subunit RPC12/RpoP